MKFPIPSALCTIAAAIALSGCVSGADVSRDLTLDTAPNFAGLAQNWAVTSIDVVVPRSLTVSEANGIRPAEDIVWQEDPEGDRYLQIEDLIEVALGGLLVGSDLSATTVAVAIEVGRFHTLTDRARYSIGGTHEIWFTLTVWDAQSGAILNGPREVDLSFEAFGGQRAIDAEAQGLTQRARITERLQAWAAETFTPGAASVTE